MSTLATIYNFETQFEDAFAALFTAEGLNGIGPSSAVEFQKQRPRCEFLFTPSGANDSRQFQCPDGKFRHDLYGGTLTIAIITNERTANGAVATDHSTYRAAARKVMATAYEMPLADFEIRYLVAGATTPSIKPEDGSEVSNLTYEIRFNIKSSSWPTP